MISIGYEELALGSVLLLMHGAISLVYRTGVAVSLLIASVRMVVQLGLMAYVLGFLFASEMPLWTMLAVIVMIGFAGYEIMARQKRPIGGGWGYGIGISSVFMSATLVTVFALFVQIKPDPWYEARYAVPLLGMVLGNTMTGISIGLATLTSNLKQESDAIEARLALGHTKWQACETVVRQSLHTGMIGIVNSMSAAGLVFIPGMMTGQLMAGADPIEAAKYQALVMFLIAGGTAIGTTMAIFLGVYRLTDERHRLRLDRLYVKM
ncbi:YbbM seven transmembrane helix protein [Candidatus Terasakiella magnetica]|uniref:YbbM seven transmembrane helix protein n=1 Tax=Candidatus Terasakiella magnetica TaxID=1867952 RepID=A0A1C3RK01_9PROT|nr:iron export ABC transporter permease subunit FetB [Candidatus Terasakiella magnetica]SCA57553.1 YbbM seven transmembrane helix protein [Candidatus Terasakiella magnetica]